MLRLGATALVDLGLLRSTTSSAGTSSPARVLVCGDADFSYACALATRLGTAAEITATAYEDEDMLLTRYPHAAKSIAALSTLGSRVKFGVDARQLASYFGDSSRWERIVFNLPQAPPEPKKRNQIQRHRALLRDFCSSAASALTPHGQLWISLLAGQGGTPLDPIQRAPGDTWQLALEAADAGLLVRAVAEVDLDALEEAGYVPTGRLGNQALGSKRKSKGMVVHVLSLARPSDQEPPSAVSPFEWSLDNSFWLDGDETPDPEAMLTHCRTALASNAAHAIAEAPRLIDSYQRQEDGRQARTYRFLYRSSVLALSKARALELNRDVCVALAEQYSGEYRTPGGDTEPVPKASDADL